jgi:hypothetical protein
MRSSIKILKMSIRRAVEFHIKAVIQEALLATHPTLPVVESLRQEERPIPSVVVLAGQAEPMLPDQPISERNFAVTVSVVYLSSVDKDTVNLHSDVGEAIQEVMRLRSSRKISRIENLHLYEIEDGAVGEENDGRQMGTGLNYKVLCHYDPSA